MEAHMVESYYTSITEHEKFDSLPEDSKRIIIQLYSAIADENSKNFYLLIFTHKNQLSIFSDMFLFAKSAYDIINLFFDPNFPLIDLAKALNQTIIESTKTEEYKILCYIISMKLYSISNLKELCKYFEILDEIQSPLLRDMIDSLLFVCVSSFVNTQNDSLEEIEEYIQDLEKGKDKSIQFLYLEQARKLEKINQNIPAKINEGTLSSLKRGKISVSEIISNFPIKSWNDVEIIKSSENYDGEKENSRIFLRFAKIKNSEKIVAVKITTAQQESSLNNKEIEFLVRLSVHKCMVKVYGVIKDQDNFGHHRLAVFMEKGEPLQKDCDEWHTYRKQFKNRKEQEAKALIILKDILNSLDVLRLENIWHMDIKPSNIIKIVNKNGSVSYKLIDFDASRTYQRNKNGETQFEIDVKCSYTPLFAAPEIYSYNEYIKVYPLHGFNFNISDAYSLGLTILYMLSKENSETRNNYGKNLQKNINEVIDKKIKDPVLKDLMKGLLKVDYKQRSRFVDIVSKLNKNELTIIEE